MASSRLVFPCPLSPMMAAPSGGSSSTCSAEFRQLRRCSRERYTLSQPAYATLADLELERPTFGPRKALELGPVANHRLDDLADLGRALARQEKEGADRGLAERRLFMRTAPDVHVARDDAHLSLAGVADPGLVGGAGREELVDVLDRFAERDERVHQPGREVRIEEKAYAALSHSSKRVAACTCRSGILYTHATRSSAVLGSYSVSASSASARTRVGIPASATIGWPNDTAGSTTTRPSLPSGHHRVGSSDGANSSCPRYGRTSSVKTCCPLPMRRTSDSPPSTSRRSA